MSDFGGININSLFTNGMNSIEDKAKELQAQMNAMQENGKVGPEQMLALQFEMGQYNAMIETISTVTKSLTDSMKSIAQRAN